MQLGKGASGVLLGFCGGGGVGMWGWEQAVCNVWKAGSATQGRRLGRREELN